MERTRAEAYEFLTVALDMGEALMDCGAEVNRVEDTISRMGFAYGAIEMNVFVITTSIVVTMELSEGNSITLTRRVKSQGNTDFRKLARINNVSRHFCNGDMTILTLKEEFIKAKRPTTKPRRLYAGSAIAAGAFAIFFGGNVWDGLVAALIGLFICWLQRHVAPAAPNTIIYNIMSALVIGFGVCLLVKIPFLTPILSVDKILIGDIMLLIPGVAMTNAIRDILVGDTVAGTMRIIETIMWAGALAAGFIVSFWVVGGVTPEEKLRMLTDLSPVMQDVIAIASAAIGSLGFALLYRLRPEHIPLAALGGALTWGTYLVGIALFDNIFAASLLASIFCTLYAEVMAKLQKTPATVLLIPSIIPLIPGSTLYYTMSEVVQRNLDSAWYYARLTIQYALAIALGVAIVWTVWAALFQRKQVVKKEDN